MKKILILHDKLTENPTLDEKDTITELQSIRHALTRRNFTTETAEFTFNYEELENKTNHFDCVFNLTETLSGSSLLFLPPLYLEQMGRKFTGVDSQAMYLTSNKLLSKKIMLSEGIPCPAAIDLEDFKNPETFLNKKLILKPVNQEASIGITDASIQTFTKVEDLEAALENNQEKFFAETYIDGREFNISVIQSKGKPYVLSPAEMQFKDFPNSKPKIVGYRAKWLETSFEYTHTQRCFDFENEDNELLEKLIKLSKKIYNIFCKKGYIRIDYRIDKVGNPYVMEVNANPCIAKDSGFTAACRLEGFDYNSMIKKIVEQAIEG